MRQTRKYWKNEIKARKHKVVKANFQDSTFSLSKIVKMWHLMRFDCIFKVRTSQSESRKRFSFSSSRYTFADLTCLRSVAFTTQEFLNNLCRVEKQKTGYWISTIFLNKYISQMDVSITIAILYKCYIDVCSARSES